MGTIAINSTPKMPNISSQLKKGEKLVYVNGKWTIVTDYTMVSGNQKTIAGGFVDYSTKNNSSLTKARAIKNNEYYIPYSAVEDELIYYMDYFKDATIYCPVDKLNAEQENAFEKFFVENMKFLGIKKLICTYYNPNQNGVANIYTENSSITITLHSDGSFNTKECKNYMHMADIVVANPSGSTARQFISQIMDFDKKFIIVGDVNMVPYKDVFKYFMFKKMWCGYTKPTYFITDNTTPTKPSHIVDDGIVYEKFGNKVWFTNLPVENKKELSLSKRYNSNQYINYDESDVIEVSKVKNIPCDFDGVMGVPLNFMEDYNPNQFEIVGRMNSNTYDGYACYAVVRGKNIYQRILIRRIK